MAKKEEESTSKEFKLPEALSAGYTFMDFVEYLVDRVPEFQSVSGARKGAKLVDAVEAAEKSEDHIVLWPTELWNVVCALLKNDQFQMPKNFVVFNGRATDRLLPLRTYLPLADAILEAEDAKPKSAPVDQPVDEEAKAAQA